MAVENLGSEPRHVGLITSPRLTNTKQLYETMHRTCKFTFSIHILNNNVPSKFSSRNCKLGIVNEQLHDIYDVRAYVYIANESLERNK